MMTEDEAKTKWCPFARFTSASNSPSSNRWRKSLPEDEPYALNPVPCRCIGHACMAWRWQPLLADDAFVAAVAKAANTLGDKSPSHTKAVKHVRENRAEYGLPTKPFLGFCGLASKPDA